MALTKEQKAQRQQEINDFTALLRDKFSEQLKTYYKNETLSEFEGRADVKLYHLVLGRAFAEAAKDIYRNLGYKNLFKEVDTWHSYELFHGKTLPPEYAETGIMTDSYTAAKNACEVKLRGGKNGPCRDEGVYVIYKFTQLNKKQKEGLIGRISADAALMKRCQIGFYDLKLFDLCAEFGVKLLPLTPADFAEVLFREDAWGHPDKWHDDADAAAVTPAVLLYFTQYMEESIVSYLKKQGLNPGELLKKQMAQPDYNSLDTIEQLLERPLSDGIPDTGATLPELSATESLPYSDAGIFSVCGDINVPEGKYEITLGKETYEEFCERWHKLILDGLTENFEKARRLAKRMLKSEGGKLPLIRDDYIPLILHKNGVCSFSWYIKTQVEKTDRWFGDTYTETERQTDYEHNISSYTYNRRRGKYIVPITGVPEIHFFDSQSLISAGTEKNLDLLYLSCLWQLAAKLVVAGCFAPQTYYIKAGDTYSIRWIPDVRIEPVRELCAQIGYALQRSKEETGGSFITLSDDFPDSQKTDPGQLGVTVLSKFIQSYVYTAALGKSRRYMPEYYREYFPYTQSYFSRKDRCWYFDALFDILKPFNEVTRGLQSVLLLEEGSPEEHELSLARQALEAVPAPKTKGRKTKALKEAEENLRKAQEAYDLAFPETAADAPEDPFFSVTLAFRDLDAEEDQEYGEDEMPPVITYQTVMNDDRYLKFRLQASLKQQNLDKVLPGMISKDKPRAQMRLSELSDKIITVADDIRARGFDIIMPRELRNLIRPVTTLSLGIKGSWNESSGFLGLESLLDFDWQIALGKRKISKKDFDTLLKKAGKVVRFAGQYVYISKQDAVKFQNRLKAKPSRTSGARLIGVALCGKYGSENVFISQKLKDSIAALLKDQDLEIPREIKAELRPYQVRGFRWLTRNLLTSMGSILADDMGLGKTLQLITALQYLKNKGELKKEKALIVVPTAVIINWSREIAKFAPDLSCNLFYGLRTDLKLIDTHDVTVTTYGTMRSHEKELSAIKFRVIVLDEAQAIKNTTSQVFKAATALKARAMVAMTGTPVENRLLEYWAIMDFVNAGLLGSQRAFKEEIANPIEKDRNQEKLDLFRAITAPFILRRLKTDKNVIADLPDKTVTDQFCELTPVQAALYESVVDEGLEAVSKAADKFHRGSNVLLMMLKLKQICNAPEHFSEDSPHKGAEFSGKAESLFEILDELGESERKCLIFTQFKKMGDILVNWIYKKTGKKPKFINGEVPVKKRTEIVDSFQNDPDERVLVLSLKAAGTGLNLTAATAVIHYDLWWNPAVEEQATDRAYRIGQRKDVQVFRLICANTFEEKINELIASKRELSDLTVVTGEQWIGNLDDNELSKIFRLTK